MNIKISKDGHNEKKLYFETLDLNGILDGTKFELYILLNRHNFTSRKSKSCLNS